MSTARVRCSRPASPVGGPVQLYLNSLGWIDAAVSDRNKLTIGLQLQPTAAQRKALATKLFGLLDGNVAGTASLRGAIAATVRKGFGGAR
jgi:cellulose synthase (UDP-forming)